MSGYDSLAEFVGHRADRQQVAWRKLMGQCDGAKRKLAQLRGYAERYRVQMDGQLSAGMEATASLAFLRFIGQIETVIAKQETEVARLERVCLEQWHLVVEARREKRMYEILRDKETAEKLGAELRRSQAEIDELTGRIVKLL